MSSYCILLYTLFSCRLLPCSVYRYIVFTSFFVYLPVCSYASWRTVEFARLVLQWHYTTFLVLPCIFYPFELHFCFLPLSSVLCNKCLTVLSVYMFETLCFVVWSMQPAGNKNDWHLCNSRWGQRRHLRICVLLMDLRWLRLYSRIWTEPQKKFHLVFAGGNFQLQATFLGQPHLHYSWGLAVNWRAFFLWMTYDGRLLFWKESKLGRGNSPTATKWMPILLSSISCCSY